MSPAISARGSHGKSGRPPRRGATAGPQGGAVPPAPSLLLPGPGSLGHPSKWRFCAQCSSAVWFPGERLPASGAREPCLCSRIFHPHHPPTWFCGIGFPRAALPPHRMVGGCTRGSCVPQLVLTLTPPHTHAASLTSINGGCCVSPSPPPHSTQDRLQFSRLWAVRHLEWKREGEKLDTDKEYHLLCSFCCNFWEKDVGNRFLLGEYEAIKANRGCDSCSSRTWRGGSFVDACKNIKGRTREHLN